MDQESAQFQIFRSHLHKRPGMYWGNMPWITHLFNFFIENSTVRKINIKLRDNGFSILVDAHYSFTFNAYGLLILSSDIKDEYGSPDMNTVGFLLGSSQTSKMNCDLFGYGQVILTSDNGLLAQEKSDQNYFSLDIEFDEYFLGFLNYSAYRMRAGIQNWLYFNSGVEVIVTDSGRVELLRDDRGLLGLFDGMQRFYTLLSTPFRAMKIYGNVEIELIVGFQETYDSDVKSYMNGQRLIGGQGKHVDVLDAAIRKLTAEWQFGGYGGYVALLSIKMPAHDIYWEGSFKDSYFGNKDVFKFIEALVSTELPLYINQGNSPFDKRGPRLRNNPLEIAVN